MFQGNWNPERRRVRMAKDHGTLPSVSNSAVLAPGGAKEGIVACGLLLSAFVLFTRFLSRL